MPFQIACHWDTNPMTAILGFLPKIKCAFYCWINFHQLDTFGDRLFFEMSLLPHLSLVKDFPKTWIGFPLLIRRDITGIAQVKLFQLRFRTIQLSIYNSTQIAQNLQILCPDILVMPKPCDHSIWHSSLLGCTKTITELSYFKCKPFIFLAQSDWLSSYEFG